MKSVIITLFLVFFMTAGAADLQAGRRIYRADDEHRHTVTVGYDDDLWDEDTSFDLDDGSIIITHEYYKGDRDVVEITDDYRLIINDEEIPLDADQQKLVKDFHVQAMEVVDLGKKIGWEGAKIGIEGAKLGLKAVGSLFKLLLPGYDTDDYEDEMEREAELLEMKADVLEDVAEDIEWMVEDLFDLADEMRYEIPAVDSLGWF